MGFVIIGAVLAYGVAGFALWMGVGWMWSFAMLLITGSATAILVAAWSGTGARKRTFQRVDGYDRDAAPDGARRTAN